MLRKTILLLLLFVLVACDKNSAASIKLGDLKTESHSVEVGDLSQAAVKIEMSAGVLKIAGGSSELLSGSFTYNIAEWDPTITSDDGNVTVTQGSDSSFNLDSFRNLEGLRNEWDIQLNQAVELDLQISLGAGESNLDLSSLLLERANIETGAGETTIDLSGDWQQDATIKIEAGIGELTIIIPKEIGVSAEIDKGIATVTAPDMLKNDNTYTNTAYATASTTLALEIDAGIGEVILKLEK